MKAHDKRLVRQKAGLKVKGLQQIVQSCCDLLSGEKNVLVKFSLFSYPMNPAKENKLYNDRPDLWSVTRVLVHSPEYKKQLWSLLSDEDKAIIRSYATPVKS